VLEGRGSLPDRKCDAAMSSLLQLNMTIDYLPTNKDVEHADDRLV